MTVKDLISRLSRLSGLPSDLEVGKYCSGSSDGPASFIPFTRIEIEEKKIYDYDKNDYVIKRFVELKGRY